MIICVKCQVEMRPAKNGFLSLAMSGPMAYQVFSSDKWKCPQCGTEVLLLANDPLCAHFNEGFIRVAELTELRFWGSVKDKSEGSPRDGA